MSARNSWGIQVRSAQVRVAAAVTTAVLLGSSMTLMGAGPAAAKAKPPSGLTNQTLTLQFNQPVSLNPALEGTAESDIVFGALDYDSLIFQLPNGQFVGDLATSWSYVPGSNNTKFNLTIRQGVTFSDGSAVTPQAVANSLEYFKSANGPQGAFLAGLTSATVTGPNTLQLTFAGPQPDLPFLLDQYQCVGQIIGPQGIANPAELQTTSDGAGPYILSASQSVANSSYVFTLNPHYWNPKAVFYKQVVVKVIADPQSALASVESGQVNVLTGAPTTIASAAKSAGLTTYTVPFSIAALVLMDRGGSVSPLGKLDVREAINDAVNRSGMAKALGGPTAVPTDEDAVPGATGYDPALAHAYSFNLTKAKKLMAEAGYAHGFSLAVLDTAALDPNGDIGTALKSELAAIGIKLNITLVPSPAQFIPAALSKKYPAVVWPIAQDGPGFAYSVQFGLIPFTNAFNTTSATLNSLLSKAGGATASQQPALYQKVDDFLVKNAWYVPLFSLGATFVVGKSVANVSAPNSTNATIDPVATNPALSWYPSTG